MRKILKLGAILAAAMSWASLAQAGTWPDNRNQPDYGGHYRHGHRDWGGGYGYYGGGGGRGSCWVWDQGQWVWVCR
ncbi:hypothetical protein D1O30_10970 [Methylocystis hirsuta]|uniref:Sulfur globule protein n=1 Tax=Methylocystis hirsuta TaxID=369798 RepID=A0A3M9XPT8_9HYPH|nr:hypothetical protein D1O30_10970 [Methylocystis hirsuta]